MQVPGKNAGEKYYMQNDKNKEYIPGTARDRNVSLHVLLYMTVNIY